MNDVRGVRAEAPHQIPKGGVFTPAIPARRAPLLLVSGCTATMRRILPRNRDLLGMLKSPASGNSVDSCIASGLPWAIDNGAYSGFDAGAFRRLLADMPVVGAKGGGPLLFVVAPDVVAHAGRTLALFREWAQEIRSACAAPVALVGQDGAEDMDIPWRDFEAWFVGGSTRWKLSQASADLAAEATRRGKWVHMGRVNSLRRLRAAQDMGCDSVDGTGMSRWGDIHLEKFCRWARRLSVQPTLF